MKRFCSIFSQLLGLFPRVEFEQSVRENKAERHARGFNSWTQFVAMLFCQLGRAHSLREICGGLASCEGKLKHLGVLKSPKKSTLAYANEHRPWQLYAAVFHQMLNKAQGLAQQKGGKKKFRFNNKLVSLDSSVIDLCLSLYDWAKFRRTKGAVKLHLLLDHDGYLPSFAVITDGKKSDITVARTMKFESGTVLVMDRGYNDYDWFAELTDKGVFFVTRMKTNADYEVVGKRNVPAKSNVRRDEDIFFYSMAAADKHYFLRRIEVWDEAKQDTLVFLTNHMQFGATTIAAIYRDRWQVELFFKAIKQNLKIKTFLGTSANAVHTQIWTALIAMLIVKYLQLKSSFGWSLSNLIALLRHQLFVYRDLNAWLNDPFQAPPVLDDVHDNAQLAMSWA
jgi:Transposase DDE domain/Domain of unknown function (DUF4372)